MKNKKNSDYFESPNILWFAFIFIGLFLLMYCVFWPNDVPSIFGSLGSLASYLGKNYHLIMYTILVLSIIVHIGEGIAAFFIAKKKSLTRACAMKWFIQTTLLGFPSLRLIIRYRPDSHKKAE